MPLLLGLLLVALFIWFGETITTAAGAWLYPGQAQGWRPVGPAKLASWFLLMLISYTLVASLEGRSRLRREEGVDPDRALARALRGSLSGFMA